MQNPALIRIRDGNTLFTIAALENRYGYVAMYNGDTENNVATNFAQFTQASYKMGFNMLIVNCVDESLNDSAEEVQSMIQDAEIAYDEENELLYVKFNQPHGD
jgi:lysophospholipase L1-like esterase